jgi:class 3 adenylate cyclase
MFCSECGHQLSLAAPTAKPTQPLLSPDETLAKIKRYLPQGLAEKILSQRERIEGERKQVTVLFTDMASYTSMAEKLDPEETYSMMEKIYEILIRKVNEYGGTVNELTGDGIMALFGAPIACDHFMAGENYEQGEIYANLAAQKALKAGSLQDAIDQTIKRITCLERLPLTDERQKKIIDTRTVLSLNLAQLNRYFEAKGVIDPIIDLAIKLGYKKRLCQIRTIMGAYYAHQEENFPAAAQAFKESLTLSEEVDDIVTTFLSSYWFGSNLCLNCEFEEGTRYLQKALDISIAAGNPRGIASTKASFAHFCFFNQGMIDLAFQTSIEAVQIAEESKDDYSKGIAYNCHGVSCYGRGLFKEAEKHLLKGIGFCERVNEKGWDFLAHWCLGEIYFEMNDFSKSEGWYERGCQFLRDSLIFPSLLGWGKVGMMRAKSKINPKNTDLGSLYALSKNNKYKAAQGWIFSYIGTILMNLDEGYTTEAGVWIQKAIEEDQRNGKRFFLGRDYVLYGRLFKRKHDRPKAQEHLGKAVKIMRECGAYGWVEKAEQELALI